MPAAIPPMVGIWAPRLEHILRICQRCGGNSGGRKGPRRPSAGAGKTGRGFPGHVRPAETTRANPFLHLHGCGDQVDLDSPATNA